MFLWWLYILYWLLSLIKDARHASCRFVNHLFSLDLLIGLGYFILLVYQYLGSLQNYFIRWVVHVLSRENFYSRSFVNRFVRANVFLRSLSQSTLRKNIVVAPDVKTWISTFDLLWAKKPFGIFFIVGKCWTLHPDSPRLPRLLGLFIQIKSIVLGFKDLLLIVDFSVENVWVIQIPILLKMSRFNCFNYSINRTQIQVASVFVSGFYCLVISLTVFKYCCFGISWTECPDVVLIFEHWFWSDGHWALKWAVADFLWVHVIRFQFFWLLQLFNGARIIQLLFLLTGIGFRDIHLWSCLLAALLFMEVPGQGWIFSVFRLLPWLRWSKTDAVDRSFTSLHGFWRSSAWGQPSCPRIGIVDVLSSESKHIKFYL